MSDGQTNGRAAVDAGELLVQGAISQADTAKEVRSLFKRITAAGKALAGNRLFTKAQLDEASLRSAELISSGKKVLLQKNKQGCSELLTQFVLQKCQAVIAVARFFEALGSSSASSELHELFATEVILKAKAQCAAHFDEILTSGQADLIVKHVLLTSESIEDANTLFEALRRKVGTVDPRTGGRGFSEQEIAIAWLRCSVCFDERDAPQPEEQIPDESEGGAAGANEVVLPEVSANSDKENRAPQQNRGRKKKRKGGKGAQEKRNEGENDDGVDEVLSGEEEVDGGADCAPSPQLLADLGVQADSDEERQDGYPAHVWKEGRTALEPGSAGFNKRATMAMRKASIAGRPIEFDCQAACPPLQPHQETVAFLVHPKSPVQRFLVDHPTGSGKTREMIRVLDNFFYDPRPKVPIFPREVVCRNFYMELLRWPSRYRDYFSCERPRAAWAASGGDWKELRHHMWDMAHLSQDDIRQLCYSIREVLEMKGMSYMGVMRKSFRKAFRKKHPGEPMPLAPLRAISYASAGGSFSAILEDDQPCSALMKVGYLPKSKNVYSNKLVLLDEVHNLVRTQTQYAEQLGRLRDLLVNADQLVLVGFTGTPILDEPTEGRWLLDIIKGSISPSGDEGFLSSFQTRSRQLFAEALPRGLPDGILTVPRVRELVQKVELCGEALRAYQTKRRLGFQGQRLRNYCNICSWVGSFHMGKNSSRARVLASPEDCCPKLYAVAQAVASSPDKAIVLTGRSSGYIVMLELMRQVAARHDPPFEVATMEELAEFNHVSNLRGQTHRVLVADAAQCSEGISFLAVRRTFLTDVPASPSQFIQQCGRALRMYGHRGLPQEEQNVITQLYIATLPKWMRSTLACWAVDAFNVTGKDAEKRAQVLTGRLRRVGIKTPEELKSILKAQKKTKLTTGDIIAFFEQHGLWEEVKLLKHAVEKEAERMKLLRMEGSPAVPKTPPIVVALQALCTTPSAEDETMSHSFETADEEALQHLSQRTEEIAPALVKLRATAVDKEVFANLAKHFDEEGPSSCNVSSATRDQPLAVPRHARLKQLPRRRLRGKQSVPADWHGARSDEQGDRKGCKRPHSSSRPSLGGACKAEVKKRFMLQQSSKERSPSGNAPRKKSRAA
mmetsp:Transcript_127927/g.232883  ORF Transcript_127927/g.232883 Transcript_127927/m.232883 type:complete len:1127 (+) Transcript_127927:69-3449(+)